MARSSYQSCFVLLLCVIFIGLEYASAQQAFRPRNPFLDTWTDWAPWDKYDDTVVTWTQYGYIRGFSIPWHIDDLAWDPQWEEYPKWYIRRINCFLGVPYAQPPVGRLRFRPPQRPVWSRTYEARSFRPACPQKIEHIRKDIPTFPVANISEDCLYLNIYAPNTTGFQTVTQTRYPVMVYFHGGDWSHGTAQQFPGQVLATQEVVVVTLNYRLGALGFLTTGDRHAQGNFGIMDQQLALEFIRDNIDAFHGNKNLITIMGDGAGGASVGLHLLTSTSRGKGYYHQAVMMSGFDRSPLGFVQPFWNPRDYATELARFMNCPTSDTYMLVECLRKNDTVTWQYLVDVQDDIKPHNGEWGIAWGPTQDGGYYGVTPVIPETPTYLRQIDKAEPVKMMLGVNSQDGAVRANSSVKGLGEGIFEQTFRLFIDKMVKDLNVLDYYVERATEAIMFQYTYWAEPQNKTARIQEFINMFTDSLYGAAMDEAAKQNVQKVFDTYVYVFNFKSWNDYLPPFMGVSDSVATQYAFGWPFMNETILNQSELVARQYYDYDDRNMSEFMLTMWSNFAKYGDPTPNITRNVTWEPFNLYNLSYLVIDYWSYNWFHYRQNKYGFWREYFPRLAQQQYLHPTASPTPEGQEYVYATGFLASTVALLVLFLGVCIYLLVYQSGRERLQEEFRDSEVPFSFSRSQSQSTMSSRRTPQQPPTFSEFYAEMATRQKSQSQIQLPAQPPPRRYGGYGYGQSEV